MLKINYDKKVEQDRITAVQAQAEAEKAEAERLAKVVADKAAEKKAAEDKASEKAALAKIAADKYNKCASGAQTADSWEVILWIDGTQKGDIIIYHDFAIMNAGGRATLLMDLPWGMSKGTKNATTTTGGNPRHKQKTTQVVPWNNNGIREKYMKNFELVVDDMLQPMSLAGQITKAERDKMVAQEKLLSLGTLTEEEIAEKFASGEFCNWIISIML